MDKHSVDYELMTERLSAKKAYKYNDVKDHLIKVAFDIVKFKDCDDIDGLWQIQSADDGEIIVALYEEAPQLEVKSSWSAIPDKTASYVHLFYKNEPITKVAMDSLGIKGEETVAFVEALPKILAENESVRSAMLSELSSEDSSNLIKKYPELG